jgi:4-amino-4-deoxy-L-arabinose transferase-like glycosyltransferase
MAKAGRLELLVPAATALLLGLLAVIAVGPHRSDFSDSGDYLQAARMLLSSGTYPETGSLPFFRPPMYPLFIAFTWLAVPESVLAIKLLQVVMHAATAVIIGRIATLIFEKRVFGIVAGVIFAMHPLFLFNAAAIQTETLHTFLVTLAMWFFAKGLSENGMSMGSAIAAGAALGAAALCKPSALGVGLVLIAAVYLLTRRGNGTARSAAFAAAGMFAVILPWTAFNYGARGELILINDAGGFNLWLGNNPATLKMYEGGFADPEEARLYADHLGKARLKGVRNSGPNGRCLT